jgi:MFS family permease
VAPAAAFFGWRMVGVAFLVDFIAVGFFFYSFGIYYPAIDAEFPGGSAWVAMGIAVSNLLSGVFAPFAGRALDALPLRRVMLVGAAIVASGFGLLSLVRELWQYYLVLGTFFALGLGLMGGMASTKLVANWFEAGRGRALGIANTGISLSGLLMPTVATWLVAELGWRGGLRVYALGILCIVVPLVAALVVTRPEDVGQRPDGGARLEPGALPSVPDPIWTAGAILRAPRFWLIALPFALTFSALSSILIHLAPRAIDLGLDGYRPARVLSAAAGAGVIGKLGFGWLIDRFEPRVAVLTSFLAQAVGLALVMQADGYASLAAGAAVFGLGMGGAVPLQGAIIGQAFGRLSFGTAAGLMRPFQVPIHALGIPFAARVRDATGSFDPAFAVFLGAYAVSALVFAGLRLREPGRSGSETGLA